ncbi:MAG: GNAT family N-acetyltransferase [Thermoplasmata archaeon]|nr:GNAT family N-acetyltransferase [Thermoplasmata archaeon]
MAPPERAVVDRALGEERAFVHAFGGYSLEIPGGILVANERVPVPYFNFVQDVSVSRERIAGFFEKALDHYFQRALRPEFRVREPPTEVVDRILRRYGFRPREEPRSLLIGDHAVAEAPSLGGLTIRPAARSELDTVVQFFVEGRESEEFRRHLEVVWEHPNPGEAILPVLGLRDDHAVTAALLYEHRGTWGIHAVATQPGERGHGAATALVSTTVARLAPGGDTTVAMWSDHPRVRRRLESIGFTEVASYRVYQLDPKAELSLPAVPPSVAPRWRPPRGTSPAPEPGNLDGRTA